MMDSQSLGPNVKCLVILSVESPLSSVSERSARSQHDKWTIFAVSVELFCLDECQLFVSPLDDVLPPMVGHGPPETFVIADRAIDYKCRHQLCAAE